jgi:hypothetical protein
MKAPTPTEREKAIALRWRFHAPAVVAQFALLFAAYQHINPSSSWGEVSTWRFYVPMVAQLVLLAIEETVLRRDVKRMR